MISASLVSVLPLACCSSSNRLACARFPSMYASISPRTRLMSSAKSLSTSSHFVLNTHTSLSLFRSYPFTLMPDTSSGKKSLPPYLNSIPDTATMF